MQTFHLEFQIRWVFFFSSIDEVYLKCHLHVAISNFINFVKMACVTPHTYAVRIKPEIRIVNFNSLYDRSNDIYHFSKAKQPKSGMTHTVWDIFLYERTLSNVCWVKTLLTINKFTNLFSIKLPDLWPRVASEFFRALQANKSHYLSKEKTFYHSNTIYLQQSKIVLTQIEVAYSQIFYLKKSVEQIELVLSYRYLQKKIK